MAFASTGRAAPVGAAMMRLGGDGIERAGEGQAEQAAQRPAGAGRGEAAKGAGERIKAGRVHGWAPADGDVALLRWPNSLILKRAVEPVKR
jgi:hypothetical protein